ncbi:MAG: cytochrome c [Candidatus Dormiibacterota bacterium]
MVQRFRRLLPTLITVCVPLVLGVWTYTAFGVSTQSAQAAAALPGNPTNGQQLYSQTCATCHGANLEGGIGPQLNPITNLGDTKTPLSATYIEDTVIHGKSGVGGYGTMPVKGGNNSLTTSDVADIAAFIIQQNQSGQTSIDPVTLARSNVFWVSTALFLLVVVTWLLSRYNMRWVARRAEVRRQNGGRRP